MTDANRWKIEKVRLAEVKPFDRNPRVIGDKAMSGLRASLERFGYVEPVVWNRRTGHIVGGHQRYRVLAENGVQEAMMVVVDMSPEEELSANLTLNNPEIEGEFDEPILELLSQIEGADSGLFEALNMDGLRKAVEAMRPRQGKESYDGANREVDVDELTKECDTRCPCCGFEWKVDAADVSMERAG